MGAGLIPAGRVFLESLRLDRESAEAVRRKAYRALELEVGGFVLFGGEADAVCRLTEDLRARAGRPLWLAADLERGAGQQFRGLAVAPPPAGLARHPEPMAAVREAAARTAREARSVGINWALAPVLDLDVEPRNPIVGSRSFGADPVDVARLGGAWIDECQAGGVAACAKHFPGHGRTLGDSHLELPVVTADPATLALDMAPFGAVADRVAAVMTAHVAYPALGCDGPATRETAVIGSLLRDELGFRGLVVTDALIMAGAREGKEPDESGGGGRATAALEAGCDLLLYPPDLEDAVRGLRKAAGASERLSARFETAAALSAEMLSRFGVDSPGPGPRGDHGADAREAELSLAAACIATTGANPASLLDPEGETAVVTVWDDRPEPDRPPFGETLVRELRERGWRIASEGRGEEARLLLVAATPQGWKGVATLTPEGRAAAAAGLGGPMPAYAIVFGHLRVLESLGTPGACAWGAEAALERAAARWLDDRVRRKRAVR